MGAMQSKYTQLLAKYPLATNMGASGLVGGTGDLICQLTLDRDKPYNPRRTAEFAALRAFLVAPALHYWYPFLNRTFPGREWPQVAKRIAADQLIWAPIFMVAFFGSITAIRGQPEDAVRKVREEFWPAMLTNWKIWPVAHVVNFRFVPVHHQIMFTNFVSVGWNAVLSFMANRGSPIKESTAMAAEIPPLEGRDRPDVEADADGTSR